MNCSSVISGLSVSVVSFVVGDSEDEEGDEDKDESFSLLSSLFFLFSEGTSTESLTCSLKF